MKLPNIFAKDAVPVSYAAGSTIFETGQRREVMFVVKEGQVDIRVGGKVVEAVGVDGFFGEMALIDSGLRSATAIAKENCTLVPINEKQFLFIDRRNSILRALRHADAHRAVA